LAKKFEQLILSDPRFEICGKVILGLVCFRLKGPNLLSQNLLFVLNDSGLIHMVPSMLDDKYVIRFSVNAANANDDDMLAAWSLIKQHAEQVLKLHAPPPPPPLPVVPQPAVAAEQAAEEEEAASGVDEITSKVRRLRFGISKMVSEPRILHNKKYKRAQTATFRISGDSPQDRRKYLARKCSIVEHAPLDTEDFLS
jgi:hypothetical protein